MKPVLNFLSTQLPQRSSRWQPSSLSRLLGTNIGTKITTSPARSSSSLNLLTRQQQVNWLLPAGRKAQAFTSGG